MRILLVNVLSSCRKKTGHTWIKAFCKTSAVLQEYYASSDGGCAVPPLSKHCAQRPQA